MSLSTEVESHIKKGYFNDMAALFLADQETAIRRLFHYDGNSTL